MTAAGALARLVTILIVAAALPCRAEDAISGRWEGTARVPGDELTVVVDLAQENGAWVGSIIIPGLGLKGAPLTEIKVQPLDVNFAVKGALGIKLNLHLVSNNKLAGNFEQTGNRAPATSTPRLHSRTAFCFSEAGTAISMRWTLRQEKRNGVSTEAKTR